MIAKALRTNSARLNARLSLSEIFGSHLPIHYFLEGPSRAAGTAFEE